MLSIPTNLTLENSNLIVTFPGNKAGMSGIYLTTANYQQGSALYNEYNNLTPDGELRVATGDFHSLLINNTEYPSGQVDWISYKTTANSKDLYGKFDTLGGVDVPVVKVVSADVVDVGGDRAISGQELMYFFTPDGEGIVKKVRVIVKKLGPAAQSLPSARFLDFIGASSLGPRTEVDSFDFRQRPLGFNYDTPGAFQADWTADSGLTATIARSSLYPNLVPAFGAADWSVGGGTPSVVSGQRLDLAATDIYTLHHFNAYPANRTVNLKFTVLNNTGVLKVTFGLNRDGRSSDGEQVLVTDAEGNYTIEHETGEADHWLYLVFEQVSGSSMVYDPVAEYRMDNFSYTAPDGSYLANTNLRNCVRIISSNPNTKQLIYDFGEDVPIGQGKGVCLSVLPLDKNSIEDGAFKIIFQKPDNSWVSSSVQNMFVDYNEVLGSPVAERFNLWEDGFFGISIPDGVDEIKKIGIEWVTSESIDWLLDGFGVITWQNADEGLGSDVRRRIGLKPKGLRAGDFVLRGVQGMSYPNSTTITGERIGVVVVEQPGGGYGEKTPLTHTNLTELLAVYELYTTEVDVPFSSFTDRGYEAEIDLSSVSNYEYPVSVTNITRGTSWNILSSSGTTVIVDTAEEDYAATDTVRIECAYRNDVDPGSYSLVYENNRYYIKWGYTDWTKAHDRDSVYIDYGVSDRLDDNVGLLTGGSLHNVETLRRMRLDLRTSSPLMGTYNTMVFSDPANEIGESLLVYYPVKGSVDETMFETSQAVQDIADNLAVRSRPDPLSPLPRNYSLIPHVAFGGEMIAADPVGYLTQVSEKFYSASATNAIVSSGSLTYLRDRDADAWWWWGGSLRDNGVDYISATRNMLRRGLPESTISGRINRHRYLLELTTFAYEYTKRHKIHASTDYKGDVAYKRVWYYEAASGLYTAIQHDWDDFQESYYDPVTIDGTPYNFSYHYILVVPAFWSVTRPASDFGLTEPTLYDLMARRLDYVCKNYDTDGAIISEYIFYKHGYSATELAMYNAWRVSQGKSTVGDWPRFGSYNYIDCDDEDIWAWKSEETKQYLTGMASIAHSHNKLLGVNVQVQNVIPVANPNATVWDGYEKAVAPDGSTCVNTLDYSTSRYGTSYYDLMKSDVCDLYYVWLYYRYSAFGIDTVYDFLEEFYDLKERMIITVGLFPKEDPPTESEVIQLVQDLLADGWNVAYAGYPPMLIQDPRWEGVWENFSDYVPAVDYNFTDQKIEVYPKRTREVPFLVRF